jgi:competence protein ComEC
MTALMLFTTAWVIGILISQAAFAPFAWLLLTVPIAAVLVVGWGDARWARRSAAMLVALLLGAGRLVLAQPRINENHIAFYNDGDKVILEGVLDAELDVRSNQTLARLKTIQLTTADGEARNVYGHVLVTLPAYADARYGDRVVVEGSLSTPPVYETFSYKDYLAHQGIYAVFRADNYTIVASHQASMVKDIILQFKATAHQVLQRLYPEPQTALLSGILLGIDSNIPDTLEDAFNTTGTGHIVAISGFNLSIVAGGFASLSRRIFKKRGKTFAALTGLWLYVVMVGASAAVLRAGVMSTLGVIAVHEQRKVHGPTALAAAVLVLTLLNPYTLWDVGFQLSFAATLGMVLYTRSLENALQTFLEGWLKPEHAAALVRWSSESLLVTIAAQLVTVGVTVSAFQRLSLVSLLTNLLILPVQLYIMLFGGVSLLVGLVFVPMAQLIAWIAWLFLAYTTTVVELLARLPNAAIALGRVTLPVIWAYYAGMTAVTWWLRSTDAERQRVVKWVKALNPTVVITLLAIAGLIVLASIATPDGRLHVTFLDVGAGEAVLIETPRGRQVLVDGGEDSARTLAQVGRQLPFWDRSLDMIVLTSPDKERLAGLVAVLKRYQVGIVVTGAETSSGTYYAEWERLLMERDQDESTVLTIVANAGNRWALEEDVLLDVLWPPAEEQGSLVLQVTYGSTRLLLPGDATTLVEEALVTQYGQQLRSTVLLIPRHGASTAATPAFLQAVNPELVVVTGDKAVSPYVLARLGDLPLYRTSKHGSIECIMNGKALKIRSAQD